MVKIKYKCSVKNCLSTYPNKLSDKIRFFKFPSPEEPDRLKRWIEACNNEKLRNKDHYSLYTSFRVCSKHFEENYLKSRKLPLEAIPTKNFNNHSLREEHSYSDLPSNIEVSNDIDVSKSKKYVDVATQTEAVINIRWWVE